MEPTLKHQKRGNDATVARIDYEPETGYYYLYEYGLEQESRFFCIEDLANYLRDYPTQLLQKL